jgi:hypothetical protein
MHHYLIPFVGHSLQELPHPSICDADSLGCFPLGNAPVFGTLQPMQLISFLLAHRDSFHPSALRLSRGTFYLAQTGTFHLAATPRTIQLGLKFWF